MRMRNDKFTEQAEELLMAIREINESTSIILDRIEVTVYA